MLRARQKIDYNSQQLTSHWDQTQYRQLPETLKQYVSFTQKLFHIYGDERIDLQVFHFKQHFLDIFLRKQKRKTFKISSPKKWMCKYQTQKHRFKQIEQQENEEEEEKHVKFILEALFLRKTWNTTKKANWLWFGEKFAEGNVNIFLYFPWQILRRKNLNIFELLFFVPSRRPLKVGTAKEFFVRDCEKFFDWLKF